jgi:regulatory protein
MIFLEEISKTKGNRYLLSVRKNEVLEKYLVYENTIINYSLLSPRELSEKEYTIIKKDKTTDKLYEKALKYIEYKMRSISEVKKHLGKDIKDKEIIDQIIGKLKTNGYLNDDFYAKTYMNEKIDYDLVGPRYIREKLILKGIHYDIIDSNLIHYSEENQFDKVFELIKKETKYKIKKPYRKAYMSLKQKLVNKGFSLGVIESSLLSNIDLIKECIDEDSLIVREIEMLKKKYDFNNYLDKSKATKSLLSKGYDYETIKKHLKG